MDTLESNPAAGLITSVEAAKSSLRSQDDKPVSQDDKDKLISRRYQELSGIRMPYLDRAREIAAIVMPYLYPQPGATSSVGAPPPNQSLLGKGVINLGRSLGQTIFPASAKFFEHKMLPDVAAQAEAALKEAEDAGQGGPDSVEETASVVSGVNNALVARGDAIRQAIKSTPDAENFYQCLIHAIVAGQGLFLKPSVKDSKVYSLDRFVSVLDSSGEAVEIIAHDSVHISKFAPEHLKELFGTDDLSEFERLKQTNVEVYTRQIRRFDHWEIQVEIAGKRFSHMEGKEKLEEPPFILVPFFVFPGQAQPISWCEHLFGDLAMYENLSLTVTKVAQAASKCLMVVPPSMRTTQHELQASGDNGTLFGDAKQVGFITAQIAQNLSAISEILNTLKRDLMNSFLMNESVQRSGERVTAYELQILVQALRNLLGGLFISIGRRWQYPYLGRMEGLMIAEGQLPALPKGLAQVVLTAGVETLDAADDLQNLDGWVARGMQFGEVFSNQLNINEHMTRVANLQSVNVDKLLYTPQQMAQRQGMEEIHAMIAQLGPDGPQIVAQAARQIMSRLGTQMGQSQPQEAQAPQPPQQEAA